MNVLMYWYLNKYLKLKEKKKMPTNQNGKNYKVMVNGHMYDSFEDIMNHILNDLIEDHESEPESNEIKSMADNLFELYTNFQTAGFEKEQAFRLVLAIVGK